MGTDESHQAAVRGDPYFNIVIELPAQTMAAQATVLHH